MSLTELLERERKGVARLLDASGASMLTAVVAVLLALGAVLLGGARWLALPRPVPFVLWVVVIALAVVGARFLRRRHTRMATLASVAQQVERERALRDGSLRGTVEVANSGALGRLGAQQMAAKLGTGPGRLAPSMYGRMRRRLALGAAGAMGGLLLLVGGTVAAPDGWAALLHPVRAWRGALLDGVQLERLPNAVLRGERLTVAVRAPGRREVTVAHRRVGASWRTTSVVVRDGRATLSLEPLDADLTLYASDGRAQSDTAVVRVVERPFIGDVTVRAQFPAYLDRQEEVIPLGEPARVPQGTVLTFDGQSSTELREVRLSRETSVLELTTAGRRFTGRLVASTSGRYEWSAIGVSGPIADVPPALDLDVMPDSAPQVEILSPGVDTTVAEGDTVAVSVLAMDDHGLAGVSLKSWIVTADGDKLPPTSRSLTAKREAQWAGEGQVSTRGMHPGDELHVVATATDASPWQLTGESREIVLRLPTLSEQREAARAMGDSAVARASATAAAQKQLAQRTSDASKRTDRQAQNSGKSGEQSMSYESAEQAKALAKEQRAIAERMEEIKEAARQLEQQLRQAGALDSALQERLEQAQRLISQALTPELQEQLRKLEQASQSLSPEEARKALADLAQQQKRLREQLEKSVEMLKRAALEGSMSTLKDEAKDLSEQQRQLADSLGARDPQARSDAQKDARQLADRSRDLSEEVKDLQQRLQQEKAETGAQRVAEADRKMQESAQAMERAAQQQNQGQPQPKPGQQQQSGQQQGAQQQGAQQQGAQQQGAQQQGAQQQNAAGAQGQQQGQPKPGEQGGDKKGEQQSGEAAARQAADAMKDAAEQLAKAREQQVGEWKQELTTELDRSIQEMIQLAREQDALEQQARKGTAPAELRPQQSTLQQGVEKSAQRLTEAGQRSSLLSQRSLRTVSDARRRVEEATRQTQSSNNSNQVAGAMREASEALNVAAASLVRDRDRAESANSASGFAEMLQQLQQMAQQQGSLNSAVQDLIPRPGSQLDARAQQESRALAKQQREVAAKLDDVADRDDSGRADELAKEARQIAQALAAAQIDQGTLERQQRLFRKMLDAGRLLEEEEREDTGKREAKPWTGTEVFTPQGTTAGGRAASRFQPPTWNDLRGLTPEERRLVLEYFKKINGGPP